MTAGQQLPVITPAGGKLQVEALVANLDIGFIKVGQEGAIKVDAFPFTRFGVLHGKVDKIASGAIAEQEAKRALADATSTANAASTPQPCPASRKASSSPSRSRWMRGRSMAHGATIPLTPGMTGTVEIKTNSRRVIDWIAAPCSFPLAKIAAEAARER